MTSWLVSSYCLEWSRWRLLRKSRQEWMSWGKEGFVLRKRFWEVGMDWEAAAIFQGQDS